ncbi:hypothetical protein ACOMHN_060509 [Nucella lapillus]
MEEIQATLDCMSQKLTFMCTTADFQKLKEEIVGIKETFAHRLDNMESMLFDMAREKDQLSEEVKRLKKENGDLRGQLEAQVAEDRRLRAAHNDLEQHGRLWNVRVHGVKEAANHKDEPARDCVRRCMEIFSQRLGVPVTPLRTWKWLTAPTGKYRLRVRDGGDRDQSWSVFSRDVLADRKKHPQTKWYIYQRGSHLSQL